MINLGQEVKDVVSGFKGVAVAKHLYLNGCSRITVQPKIDKDGKLPESQSFDEPQLKVLSKKCLSGKTDTGGPEKYLDIKRY